MEQIELQRAIEAILFAAGERMELSRLAMVLETDEKDVEEAANALADTFAFERRGIRILRLEKGYQMVSSGEMADYITKALETRKPPKLSSSQLETLTIVAYYQPATKAVIEQIRGVDSSYSISALLNKKLIEDAGLKGFSVGGAQVSEKHAGFVINKGGATCADVCSLMEQVSDLVYEKFGVRLEPEVKILK